MKKNLLAMTVATLMTTGFAASAMAASSATTVPGGTINFIGTVVDAACSVSADSQDQTVTLDQVRTDQLTTAGQAAGQQKSFSILLKDCDTSVSTNASVTFEGQADKDVTTALQNTAGAGSAGNVALQLYGPDGNELPLGDISATVKLLTGDTTIPLSVDYVATKAAATPGAVSSIATFSINYS